MADDPGTDTMDRLQGHLTLALTVAARIVEVQAHRRSVEMRNAQRQSEQARHQVEQQQRAEAAATRHQLRDVGKKEWWDKATPEEVATSYAMARAYGQFDSELGGTALVMANEIRARYGVDADQLVRDTERTGAWMDAVGTDVGMATSEHARETIEAVVLTSEADALDAAARVAVADPDRFHGLSDDPEMAALQMENSVEPALAMMREGAPTEADYAEEAHDARMVAEGKWPADGTIPTEPTERASYEARQEALAARLQASSMSQEAKESRTILAGMHEAPTATLTGPAKGHKAAKAPQAPAVGKERTRHR